MNYEDYHPFKKNKKKWKKRSSAIAKLDWWLACNEEHPDIDAWRSLREEIAPWHIWKKWQSYEEDPYHGIQEAAPPENEEADVTSPEGNAEIQSKSCNPEGSNIFSSAIEAISIIGKQLRLQLLRRCGYLMGTPSRLK